MSVQDNTILVRNGELPGVDLSRVDYSMLSSFQPSWTEVTGGMWKDRGDTFIGLKEFVGERDIIEVGSLLKKYRVLRLVNVEGLMGDGRGRIFQVKRVDGNLTTDLDIDNAAVGSKVKVLGRRNFIDQIDHPVGRGYTEPCPTECKTTLPCDPIDDCDCNCE